MTLLQRLHQTIGEQDLIGSGDRVLVAVSGGPDSTALLHALHTLGFDVQAAHLNHGLRGQEADDDAEYVTDFCRGLRIPLVVERRDVAGLRRRTRVSTQEAARSARCHFLTETATRVQAARIATAHNQDDRTESVLMNILRGTGTEGLRGIAYKRGVFVRPLLDVPRADIETYCQENNLCPRRDSSNQSTLYARNNVRHELLPYVERRYNSEARRAILRLSEIASSESDLIRDQARFWLDGHTEIPVAALGYEKPAFQRRVLREWLRSVREEELTDISHALIDRLLAQAPKPFAEMLPGADLVVRSDGAMLRLERLTRAPESVDYSLPLRIGEPTGFF